MRMKRFVLAYNDDWWAVKDGEITLWKEEVVSLLNEQHETIGQLKKEAEEYNEDAMSYQTLYEQQVEKNKQLEQEIETLHEQLAHIDGGIFE